VNDFMSSEVLLMRVLSMFGWLSNFVVLLGLIELLYSIGMLSSFLMNVCASWVILGVVVLFVLIV